MVSLSVITTGGSEMLTVTAALAALVIPLKVCVVVSECAPTASVMLMLKFPAPSAVPVPTLVVPSKTATEAAGRPVPVTITEGLVVMNPEGGDVIVGGVGAMVKLTAALAALAIPLRVCVAVRECAPTASVMVVVKLPALLTVVVPTVVVPSKTATDAVGMPVPLTITKGLVAVNPEGGDVIVGGFGAMLRLTTVLAGLVAPLRACVAVNECAPIASVMLTLKFPAAVTEVVPTVVVPSRIATVAPGVPVPVTITEELAVLDPESGEVIVGPVRKTLKLVAWFAETAKFGSRPQ